MSKLWKCITLLSTFLWHHLTTKTWNVYEGREHRANFLFFQGSYRFSIQNSRLFPDFFQNNNLFFQTQGYQIADRKRPLKKKTQEQSFFPDMQARLNKIWPTRKKIHFWRTSCTAFKKTQDFLPFFQDFTSIFQTFPRSGKCWANFKTFSRIQDSVRTLPFLTWIRSFTIQLWQKFDFI